MNFWGIPKCANTAAKAFLMFLDLDNPSDSNQWIHEEARATYISKLEAIKNGYENVTIVRNPYNRFKSMYRDLCVKRNGLVPEVKDMTVDQFANYLQKHFDHQVNVHFRSQYSFISYKGHIIPKVEHLEHMSKDCIFKEMQIVNISGENFDLTKKQKNIIYERYTEDFELLGYKK